MDQNTRNTVAGSTKDPDNGRSTASTPDAKFLKEIESRGLAIGRIGASEAIDPRQAAQADVKVWARIADVENRSKALTSMGWTADTNADYRAELQRASPPLARLAQAFKGAELESAYGGTQAADAATYRRQLVAEVRALGQPPHDKNSSRDGADQLAVARSGSGPGTPSAPRGQRAGTPPPRMPAVVTRTARRSEPDLDR